MRIGNGIQTDEEVEMTDVYTEVDEFMRKVRVGKFKAKPVSRKYAFELFDIPRESDYLEVLYPYKGKFQPICYTDKRESTRTNWAVDAPLDFAPDKKFETFSHVFGTHTALFEQFVLSRNIMGPCWLTIKEADFSAVSNVGISSMRAQGNANLT